jgi:signal transduction histidine kinase
MAESRPAAVGWRFPILALAGLLVALVAVGVAGIIINRGVTGIVDEAISFDVELEDNADDLRVAILDVRHYHRDLLFNDPARQRVEAWEGRYRELLAQIDELEALYQSGLRTDGLPTTADLRQIAEDYYAAFRPEIDTYDPADPVAFQQAADASLQQLERLEGLAERLDKAGEERAAVAFSAVDGAVSTGSLVLVGLIIGLGVVALGLAAAVFTMIRQQRRLIVAEQAAVAEQTAASRAKTDFIADASHELRTPLTVLRGNAEIGLALESDCDHAESTREVLREIVDESARMSRLVDDLLFLARSDATEVPLELRRLDAADLLRSVAGRATVLARERGGRLRSRLDASGSVSVDPVRIEQAILILVDNAAKYGPPGGVVELRTRSEDEAIVVEVADRGPGIPESEQARMFERFYRAEPGGRSRRAGGAGLGLSIASAIVRGHGGEISGTSEPGAGTVMSIRLPAADRPSQEARTEAGPAAIDAALSGEPT